MAHSKDSEAIYNGLVALGYEVMRGKGGFWLRGHGHITTAHARRLTGIPARPRQYRPRVSAWGDWATVAVLNGRMR